MNNIKEFYANWTNGMIEYYKTALVKINNGEMTTDEFVETKEDRKLINYARNFPKLLVKEIEKEMSKKETQLLNRIAKKINIEEITNAELTIGHDGSLNGIIYGNDKKVTVNTIVADGLVNRMHYRVLVK